MLIGWMGVPDGEEMLQPTRAHGWIHQMTCPRELRYRMANCGKPRFANWNNCVRMSITGRVLPAMRRYWMQHVLNSG
jgi:hypothetical protein